MFIEIDLENVYALYSLTRPSGDIIHVGIVPLKQLSALSDVPMTVKNGEAYLSIIKTGQDKFKLGEDGLVWLIDKNHHNLHIRLTHRIKSWAGKKKFNEIECIETGEIFATAAEAARKNDLTYCALIRHLNAEKSYNTVKGHTYRRID